MVKLWYTPPSPELTSAVLLFLREGRASVTIPITSINLASNAVHTFGGLIILDELDEAPA